MRAYDKGINSLLANDPPVLMQQPFNFKVVPVDDENARVPVSVAGQTMVDVQRILTDIGTSMVRQELRLQNAVPGSLTARFDLAMSSSSGRDVDAEAEGDDTLMLDALTGLIKELELANAPESHDAPGNHREALARRALSKDILALADHLVGYDLYYGTGEDLKRFRLTRREGLREIAEDTSLSFNGAVIGTIRPDPVRKGRWLISNGKDSVPVTFASNISTTDIPLFSEAGPIIASGTVVTDEDGNVKEMRAVIGCYSFPTVKFHRAITAARDIILLNPVEAIPGYNAKKGMWTLNCDDLGISVSKPSWDECVVAFHEYFVFLWETYEENDGELEGEEAEVRDFLRSLALP